jgi:hypothetical protein
MIEKICLRIAPSTKGDVVLRPLFELFPTRTKEMITLLETHWLLQRIDPLSRQKLKRHS